MWDDLHFKDWNVNYSNYFHVWWMIFIFLFLGSIYYMYLLDACFCERAMDYRRREIEQKWISFNYKNWKEKKEKKRNVSEEMGNQPSSWLPQHTGPESRESLLTNCFVLIINNWIIIAHCSPFSIANC